jgi:hypothetical protein
VQNSTTLRVPAKYAHMIASVEHEQGNGYWVYTTPGFFSPMMQTGTIHEMTQTDTLAEVRTLRSCAAEGTCYCGHNCV